MQQDNGYLLQISEKCVLVMALISDNYNCTPLLLWSLINVYFFQMGKLFDCHKGCQSISWTFKGGAYHDTKHHGNALHRCAVCGNCTAQKLVCTSTHQESAQIIASQYMNHINVEIMLKRSTQIHCNVLYSYCT